MFQSLFNSLRNTTFLRKLLLVDCLQTEFLTGQQLNMEGLTSNQSLISLCFSNTFNGYRSNTGYSPGIPVEILNSLEFKNIKELSLNSVCPSFIDYDDDCDYDDDNCGVRQSFFSESQFDSILRLILNNSSITSLDLSNNKFASDQFQGLCSVLKLNS
ncbi:hypothetical protein GEMRC1_006434 [Eukaryota sp. GEM-RC1]